MKDLLATTVEAPEVDGYDVILNRVGFAPLSQCTVSEIRPGHEVTRTDSGYPATTSTLRYHPSSAPHGPPSAGHPDSDD